VVRNINRDLFSKVDLLGGLLTGLISLITPCGNISRRGIVGIPNKFLSKILLPLFRAFFFNREYFLKFVEGDDLYNMAFG